MGGQGNPRSRRLVKKPAKKYLYQMLSPSAIVHLAGKARENKILSGYQRTAIYSFGKRRMFGNAPLTRDQSKFLDALLIVAFRDGIHRLPCKRKNCDLCEEMNDIVKSGVIPRELLVRSRTKSVSEALASAKGHPPLLRRDAFDDDYTVLRLEKDLRKVVVDRLEGIHGKSWYKHGVPPVVKETIEKNLAKDATRYPYKLEDMRNAPKRLMEYTCIDDLARIVTWSINWNHFQEMFGNEEYLKRRVDQLQAFRNYPTHSRLVDPVVMLDGLGAMEWARRCLRIRLRPVGTSSLSLSETVQ